MDYDIEMNQKDYQKKEICSKRLAAYTEAIQRITLEKSSKVIDDLVEERHRQGLTQQDIADMTGIRTSNVARLEKGKRIPTLIILQKYASALGKHIEVKGMQKEQKSKCGSKGNSMFPFLKNIIDDSINKDKGEKR